VLAASAWLKQSKQSPDMVSTKEAQTFADDSAVVDITGGSVHCSEVLETWEILRTMLKYMLC